MTAHVPATQSHLDALFAPKSIAVVGASSRGRGLGVATLKTLKRFGFDGELTVVNPGVSEIDGVPSYPTLGDIPSAVDLVLMFTAADRVLATVEESIAIGAGAGVIFASGFSELGDDGTALQQQLVGVAREAGFRMLGPNCQGVVSFSSRLAATFSNAVRNVEGLRPSPVAYVGQSGAIGGSIFDLGRERGCLPSIWVSTGNQADLDVVEVADFLIDRPDLELLMLYLEQMPPGDEWQAMCAHAAAAGKRIVVLRSGTTAAGRVAVASHTGALVGADRAFQFVSSNYDVITVRDVDQVVNVAMAHLAGLSSAGRKVAIVTTSGGAGGLAADAAERAGLSMARLGDDTCTRLRAVLPAFATAQNPVDVTADLVSSDPDGLGNVCRLVAADPDVDQVLVVISVVVGRGAEMLAGGLVRSIPGLDKPVTVAYIASRDRTQKVREILSAGGVAVFDSISAALLAARRVSRAEVAPGAEAPAARLPRHGVTTMTEHDGAALLEQVGIRHPAGSLATTREEAVRIGASLSSPLVLKVQSKDVTHKTEAGGVCVGVDPSDVGAAYDAVLSAVALHAPDASVDGVLVQAMAEAGIELLLGVQVQQHGYPPLVTVGIGGTSVELYADVVSHTLPVDESTALELLRQLRGWPLLDGYRGTTPADVEAATRAIVALGPLCELLGANVVELEINPLIVHERGHGATAVDFVAYLDDAPAEGAESSQR